MPNWRHDGRRTSSGWLLTLSPTTPRSLLRKDDHVLEREAQRLAECSERSERWPPATREEVAQSSLVDLSVASQVPTCPAPQDTRTIDRRHVDRPFQGPVPIHVLARTRASPLGRAALEGTVLRVPCLPPAPQAAQLIATARRQPGFWRSSVRGPGPPESNNSVTGSRLLACTVSHTAPLVHTLRPHVDPFARRVTRMNARARCSLPTVERIARGRGAAFLPVSVAARALSPIPTLRPSSESHISHVITTTRDVSTTTWDDLRRLEASHSSSGSLADSLYVSSRRSKPARPGRFNGVLGRFETSQTSLLLKFGAQRTQATSGQQGFRRSTWSVVCYWRERRCLSTATLCLADRQPCQSTDDCKQDN